MSTACDYVLNNVILDLLFFLLIESCQMNFVSDFLSEHFVVFVCIFYLSIPLSFLQSFCLVLKQAKRIELKMLHLHRIKLNAIK